MLGQQVSQVLLNPVIHVALEHHGHSDALDGFVVLRCPFSIGLVLPGQIAFEQIDGVQRLRVTGKCVRRGRQRLETLSEVAGQGGGNGPFAELGRSDERLSGRLGGGNLGGRGRSFRLGLLDGLHRLGRLGGRLRALGRRHRLLDGHRPGRVGLGRNVQDIRIGRNGNGLLRLGNRRLLGLWGRCRLHAPGQRNQQAQPQYPQPRSAH